MPTIKAKEGDFFVFFITGEFLKFFFCSVSKENVGDVRFFDSFTFAIDDFYSSPCGIEGGYAIFNNVIVGFFLSAISGTKSVPMWRLFSLFDYCLKSATYRV